MSIYYMITQLIYLDCLSLGSYQVISAVPHYSLILLGSALPHNKCRVARHPESGHEAGR